MKREYIDGRRGGEDGVLRSIKKCGLTSFMKENRQISNFKPFVFHLINIILMIKHKAKQSV